MSSLIHSLLNAAIAATAPTESAYTAILPYANLLPQGHYFSEIISAADAAKDGIVIGIDCVHKLTNLEGRSFLVKFRFFTPRDTDDLMKTLQAYGLTGSVGGALTGLKEEVDIAQRPGSDRYVYITKRSLVPNPSAAQESHAQKKVGLSGRLSRRSSSVQNENIKKFFANDEEDDFEDFFDEEDD